MCTGNFHTSVKKIVISAHAEYATNKVSGPMSNGGAGPKSPRHIRIVRTCWRFSSSTYATIQSTFGKSPWVSWNSPFATSYSKSQTTIDAKFRFKIFALHRSGVAAPDDLRSL